MGHNGGVNKKDPRDWLETNTQRKITVQEIAHHLNMSRNSATRRIAEGFTADEIITLTTNLNLNPAQALTELGYITPQQAAEALTDPAHPMARLTDAQIAHELFRRLLRREADNANQSGK